MGPILGSFRFVRIPGSDYPRPLVDAVQKL